jgi:dolichol kinase
MNGTWTAERGRKLVHLATVVLPVWIWCVAPPWTVRGPVLAFLGVLLVDVARLRVTAVAAWFARRVDPYLRPRERTGPVLAVHFLTGVGVLLAAIAPRPIAATALAYLVLGDAAAALVGRRFGKRRFGAKSLEGSLACFVCCLAAGALTLPAHPAAVLGGALAATIAEALPGPLDDNLSVPLLGAAVLALLV